MQLLAPRHHRGPIQKLADDVLWVCGSAELACAFGSHALPGVAVAEAHIIEPAKTPMASENPHQIAARIAHKFRDVGVSCETLNLVPTNAAVLRRDRIVVILALILLTALAWSYLLWLSAKMNMGGMDMTGFRIIPAGMGLIMPAETPWRAMEFAFVFAMWTMMMVGMMTPSAVPMILMYARAGRQTKAQGAPLLATIWFVVGYFLAWAAFSLFATLVQWALERAALLDSAMASTSNILGGLVFLAVGTYEWTRLKDVCLAQCQTPFAFLMRHGGFRREAPSALMLGLRHGVYCVGCCWSLMALLLVGGIMNVLWIVLLALLILSEKVASSGRVIARVAGAVFIVAGAWLLANGIS
jgi:predicted metal-binding membrane protein